MKFDTMKIKRELPGGVILEIALTEDEIYRAYEAYEHHCDADYVEGRANSGTEEWFEYLSDEQWEAAVHEIAWEKRRQQDKYGYDASDALDEAMRWFKNTRLPEILKRRYFEIRLGCADENTNVVVHCGSVYCWAYKEVKNDVFALEYCRENAEGTSFEEIIEVNEIPANEVDLWFDNPSEVPEFEWY